MIADEIRAISQAGLGWSADAPYDRDRYERLLHAAAQLFALVDERDVDEIERTVFTQLTHLAPVPVADAAIVGDDGRIFLIQRADNGLWALPGGMLEMGETPAEGALREAREEAGIVAEGVDLIGVFDSRLHDSRSALQLYAFVFLCRQVGTVEASTPHEVHDGRWFARDELPPLSPGHGAKVPHVFEFLEHRRPHFDVPG
ncbi:MAG: NUDIX hydrolase N-terminal domain-containing protein [Acidimicrobiia bacterium]|nr:NUDIX hydrolase N-terminal domain-containing protein [Acidimicrobiia bacterium]